jgi:HD-GYP domain-containing protein (c-di-GMP phosphodiesterase class II)
MSTESIQNTLVAPAVARDIVHQFFVLLKTAGIYDRTNEGYLKPAARAKEVFEKAFAEEGNVTIEVKGDHLFFNRQRIRFEVEGYAGGRFLIDEMTRRQVGAIEILKGADMAAIHELVFAFNSVEIRKGEGIAQVRERLQKAQVTSITVQIYVPEENEKQEPEDNRDIAKREFFRAVNIVEDVMTRARAGQAVNFAQAKRVVHNLVDKVIDDEQTLLELSTIHNFDEYTYAHSVNVCVYTITIGIRLGLDRAQLSELGFGGLFHDIGKVKLPLELINKPDEYNEFDWSQMRLHPTLGAKTLLTMRRQFDRVLARAISMAFEHHIGLDGSGYPRVVNPRKPELFSRICSIADAFDAMTSGRVYIKKPMAPDEVLRKMIVRAGTGYDTFLLKLFINAIGVFPIGTLLLLDTNELGVVYRNNSEDLMRPKVRVFADKKGEREVVEIIDLTRKDPETGRYLRSVKQMVDPHKYGIDIKKYVHVQ